MLNLQDEAGCPALASMLHHQDHVYSNGNEPNNPENMIKYQGVQIKYAGMKFYSLERRGISIL